jgi:hypothetical protein
MKYYAGKNNSTNNEKAGYKAGVVQKHYPELTVNNPLAITRLSSG